MEIKVLNYKGQPLSEVRPAYFLKAFDKDILNMRIFSFGRCNYSCSYCKRDGYNKNDLDICGAVSISEKEFMQAVDDAISKKQVVRLSGGDPVCYPTFTKKVLKYAKEKGAITSIAHNGSAPYLVENIVKYLDFASIDFKAPDYRKLAKIACIDENMAKKCFCNTIETINILAKNNVYVDVRTCIFEDTNYEELDTIAKYIQMGGFNENKFWTLRTYSPVDTCDKKAKTDQEMRDVAVRLSQKYTDLKIGLRMKWAPGGFVYFYNGKELKDNELYLPKSKAN